MRIAFAALALLAVLALVLFGTGVFDGTPADLDTDSRDAAVPLDFGDSLGRRPETGPGFDAQVQRSGVETSHAKPEELTAGESALAGRVVDRLQRTGLPNLRVVSTRRYPLIDRLVGFRVDEGMAAQMAPELVEARNVTDEGTFAVTTSEGAFQFSRRRDGSFAVLDDPYYFARAMPKKLYEGSPVQLEVERGGRVLGTIDASLAASEGPLVVQLLGEGGGGGFGRGRRGMPFSEPQDVTLYQRGTLADASGAFTFQGVPADANAYRLRVMAKGFGTRLSESFEVKAGQDTMLTVAVPRGIEVVGQVTAEEGGPVPFASVEVFYEGEVRSDSNGGNGGGRGGRGGPGGGFGFGGLPTEPLLAVQSDADGRFSVAGLSDGRYRLTVQAEGYVRNERGRVEVNLGGHAPVTVTLQPSVLIEGTVVRGEGKPVADAIVRTVNDGGGGGFGRGGGRGGRGGFGRGFGTPAIETTTDAQGHFTIDGFEANDRVQLEAVSPDGWMGVTSVGRDDDRSNVMITLEPTGSIAVELAYPAGVEPAAEVRIELTEGEGFFPNRTETFTRPSPQGMAIERVATGAYRVDVRAEGFVRAQAEVEVVANAPASVVIPMNVGTAIRGIAMEAGTGRPVVGAEIAVTTDFFAMRDGGSLPLNTGLTTRSDATGQYALEHLASGTLTLTATHPDYPEFRSGDLEVLGDRDLVGVQVLFTPGGTIQGIALDADGVPREGLMVRAESTSGDGGGGPGRGRGGFGGPGGARTDATGRYEIENLRPGEYRVGLMEMGGGRGGRGGRGGGEMMEVRTVALQPGQQLTVDFLQEKEARATLVGTVTDDGRPVGSGSARLILASGGRPMMARIEEDGTFRFEDVVLGVHQVQIDVADDGGRGGRGGRGFGGFSMGGARFDVELLEAGEVEKAFALPSGVIAGTARDLQGASDRVRVRLLRQRGARFEEVGNANVDQGRFQFDHLEAGSYRVIAESTARFGRGRRGGTDSENVSSGAPAAAFVELGEGQHADGVSLTLVAPGSFAFVVEDQAGEPVRNARVLLEGAEDDTRDYRGFGGTNGEGEGTITDLAAGTYQVTVSNGDLGTINGGQVVVVAGSEVRHSFRLTPGVALRVTLKDENGEAVDDANLEVFDASGALMASYPQRGGPFGGSGGRPADGVYTLGKLPAGTYRIDVTHSLTRRKQSFDWRHVEGREATFTVSTQAPSEGK